MRNTEEMFKCTLRFPIFVPIFDNTYITPSVSRDTVKKVYYSVMYLSDINLQLFY